MAINYRIWVCHITFFQLTDMYGCLIHQVIQDFNTQKCNPSLRMYVSYIFRVWSLKFLKTENQLLLLEYLMTRNPVFMFQIQYWIRSHEPHLLNRFTCCYFWSIVHLKFAAMLGKCKVLISDLAEINVIISSRKCKILEMKLWMVVLWHYINLP